MLHVFTVIHEGKPLVQFLFRPAEGIQGASCKSRLRLLLQVQSNLFGLFLRLCTISPIILLPKSHLHGPSNFVAAVNKAFSFLIHACCLLCLDLGHLCVMLVCVARFYGRAFVFCSLVYRIMCLAWPESCVHVCIVDGNTLNYCRSKAKDFLPSAK